MVFTSSSTPATEPAEQLADRVLGAGSELLERFQRLPHLGDAGQRIRVHGDYDLGQQAK